MTMTMAAGRAAARTIRQALDSGLRKFGETPGGGGAAPAVALVESIERGHNSCILLATLRPTSRPRSLAQLRHEAAKTSGGWMQSVLQPEGPRGKPRNCLRRRGRH